ncbi:hypothetical protein LCGC14_0890430 [marine sediment metagenome]|uniref:Uncharacterized protein n=1 Tax=marine sediment metagenome TaxID=412755 RepID=A0A0F9S6F8_9ZZZZ
MLAFRPCSPNGHATMFGTKVWDAAPGGVALGPWTLKKKERDIMTNTEILELTEVFESVYLSGSNNAVLSERVEQIVKHGRDAAHDDNHIQLELARAAEAILREYAYGSAGFEAWPWQTDGKDKTMFDHIVAKKSFDQLAVAGALILAEMDRLDRIAKKTRRDAED